jgi:hypothetical protein
MNKKRRGLIVFCLLGFLISIQAQEAVIATGGGATGNRGSVSYTVGQVAYMSNVSTSGIVTQGVQQPYEIIVVTGIEEAMVITLECLVYPNPTIDILNLKIEGLVQAECIASLYDINGKLLQDKKVVSNETSIPMGNLTPATYFLKVTLNKKGIKTFKIIKN